MGDSIAEKGEITLTGITGEDIIEHPGDFFYCDNILLLTGRQIQCHRLVINMDIQGNQQGSGIGVLPKAC